MLKILDPQYGNDFVGREDKIEELKEKIKNNGIVVVTGDRGIGKTNLTFVVKKVIEEQKPGLLKKKPCYHVNGSLFYEDINKVFAPSKRLTGFSGSVSTPIAGAGGGISWDPREVSILEYMEKSKEKLIFVENAHELKKEDFETILETTRRNGRLRFVLEIATPYMPDLKLRAGSYEVVEVKELKDADIEQIVRRECPYFSDVILHRIVELSKGYPYVAQSLGYICDKKNTKDEIFAFLKTLRDDDMRYNLDRIHKEVLETLNEDSREVIKSLAIAPAMLTLNLIAAFCGEEVDSPLTDIKARGILVELKEFYRIYHLLFREYLRNLQPLVLKNKQELYSEAIKKVKAEFDLVIILFEVIDELFFEGLLKQAENYEVINFVGIQNYTRGKLEQALCAWTHLLERTKGVDKEWEVIATGNIGMAFQIKGELDKAMGYYEKALELSDELGLKKRKATVLGNIGIVYFTRGELDKAFEYYEKALELDEELGKKKEERQISLET
jgi:tetratricopeptide (TPR) repeat protein